MVNPTMGPSAGGNINTDSKVQKGHSSSTGKKLQKVETKDRHEERQRDDGKKFKKLDDADFAVKKEFDEFLAQDESEVHVKASTSIFDLESLTHEEPEIDEEVIVKEMPPEMGKESLSALFQGLGTKEKLASMQKQVVAEKPVDTEYVSVNFEAPEKPKVSTVFMHEQPDLTAVNPIAGLQIAALDTSKNVSPTPIRTNIVDMQDLVDQMVKQITILSSSGKTDTMITLKHPPLFEGANLTVTTFNSAKGQFNITFENLSQAAKQLIDMSENQTALKSSLEQKGYMVHILVATTTTIEDRQTVKGEQLDSRRDGEQNQDREDKEERKKR